MQATKLCGLRSCWKTCCESPLKRREPAWVFICCNSMPTTPRRVSMTDRRRDTSPSPWSVGERAVTAHEGQIDHYRSIRQDGQVLLPCSCSVTILRRDDKRCRLPFSTAITVLCNDWDVLPNISGLGVSAITKCQGSVVQGSC